MTLTTDPAPTGDRSTLEPVWSRSRGEHTANTTLRPSAVSAGPGWLTTLSVLYLALPLLVFFLTWLRPIVGVPLAAAMGWCLRGFLPGRSQRPSTGSNVRWSSVLVVAGAAAVIALWVGLSGVVHVVYANEDWQKHHAVFTDLVRHPWPVTYFDDASGTPVVLRYYLGWYLVPAGIAKLVAPDSVLGFAYVWTCLGVGLFVANVLALVQGTVRRLVALAVLVGFSGLDVVGMLLTHPESVGIGTHLEQWPVYFSYDSITTGLFWAPQHLLPGVLFGAVAFRSWRAPWFARVLCPFLLLLPFWSPITAVGALPVAGVVAAHHWREGGARRLIGRPSAVVLPLLLVGAMGLYLGQHLGGNPAGFSWAGRPGGEVARHYVLFVLLEVLVLVAAGRLLGPLRERPLVVASVATLLVIPLFKVGVFNDLAMRGSVVGLTVLLCAVVAGLGARPAKGTGRHGRAASLLAACILLVGAVTPAEEIARTWTEPMVPTSRIGLLQELGMAGAYFPSSQYLAARDSRLLDAALRDRSPEYRFGPPLDVSRSRWTLECDCDRRTVEASSSPPRIASPTLVDAYLRSDIVLQPGLYEIDASFTYDLLPSPRNESVWSSDDTAIAHLSVMGQGKVMFLDAGHGRTEQTKYVSVGDQANVAPLVLGLGGWSEGRGAVQLDRLVVRPVLAVTAGPRQ